MAPLSKSAPLVELPVDVVQELWEGFCGDPCLHECTVKTLEHALIVQRAIEQARAA